MRVVLVLLIVLAAGGWAAITQLPDGAPDATSSTSIRRQEIASVSLDGANLPIATLRATLATKAGDLIDLATVERDRETLRATLVSQGYLLARVDVPRVTFDAAGATYVTFPVVTGTVFRIGSVIVEGAAARDAGVVTLGEGEVADAERIAYATRTLEERLRVRGVSASVTASFTIDEVRGLADLRLVAVPR